GDARWTQQIDYGGYEEALGVAADASGVYVAGFTSTGGGEAFMRKYDSSGHPILIDRFGTTGADAAYGVAVNASGIYVVGSTRGTFPDQTSAGHSDAFV